MRILITGNMGYVGSVLCRHLRSTHPDAVLIGYDIGYFAHCLTGVGMLPETSLDEQHFGDIRDFPAARLRDVDAVVNLAAISNDPMGERFEAATEEINYSAAVRLAKLAVRNGVRSFVFASSCSVYGSATSDARHERDERDERHERDELNPLTAYARSKIATEDALGGLDRGAMTITCLRFATACGMSDRLRLDLVLNDFVAGALANGAITVLSDGTPWRPLIDVKDMARAIDWATQRKPTNGGDFLVVNVGSATWNYQVKELANAVAGAVPGTKVSINLAAPPDKRSYRVDFSLYRALAPNYLPRMTLEQSIAALRSGLAGMGFSDPDFRNSQNVRLKVLERHIAAGRLTPSLRWQSGIE